MVGGGREEGEKWERGGGVPFSNAGLRQPRGAQTCIKILEEKGKEKKSKAGKREELPLPSNGRIKVVVCLLCY